MGKAEKIKREHIKKVNELLDKGHNKGEVRTETIILKPSNNVSNSSKEFINKMERFNYDS
jgi:hypothetical protein